MAAFDENPFQVASADQAFAEQTRQGAVETRASELRAEQDSTKTKKKKAKKGAVADQGHGGIGRNVPQRNFMDPGIQPPTWFSNKDRTKCVCCEITFTTFIRRHHCRGCGLIFCADCTPAPKLLLPLSWKATAPERVCGTCARPLINKQDELRPHYSLNATTVPRKEPFAFSKSVLGIK